MYCKPYELWSIDNPLSESDSCSLVHSRVWPGKKTEYNSFLKIDFINFPPLCRYYFLTKFQYKSFFFGSDSYTSIQHTYFMFTWGLPISWVKFFGKKILKTVVCTTTRPIQWMDKKNISRYFARWSVSSTKISSNGPLAVCN